MFKNLIKADGMESLVAGRSKDSHKAKILQDLWCEKNVVCSTKQHSIIR